MNSSTALNRGSSPGNCGVRAVFASSSPVTRAMSSCIHFKPVSRFGFPLNLAFFLFVCSCGGGGGGGGGGSTITNPKPKGPVLSGFARIIDANRNSVLDQGDHVIVPFNVPVQLKEWTGDIADYFKLQVAGDSFGSGASLAEGPLAHEMTVTLGTAPHLKARLVFTTENLAKGAASGIDISQTQVPDGIVDSKTAALAVPSKALDLIASFDKGVVMELGSSLATAFVSADLDGDSWADLVISSADSGGLRFLINKKTGGFNEVSSKLAGSYLALASGDVDRDGDVDLVTADQDGSILLLLNESGSFSLDAGRFRNITTLSTKAILLSDADGDGDLDLFMGNLAGSDQLWLNDGKGMFTNSGQHLGLGATQSIATADLDRDGDQDFVALGSATLQVFENVGGHFSINSIAIPAKGMTGFGLADIDGNGYIDLIFGHEDGIAIWLNDTGKFTDSGNTLAAARAKTLLFKDYDADGDLDLLSTQPSGKTRLWENTGNGRFFDLGLPELPANMVAALWEDFDRDGDFDLLLLQVSPRLSSHLSSLSSVRGETVFIEAGRDIGAAIVRASGDLDGDGDLDLLTSDVKQGAKLSVWLNNGQGGFSLTGASISSGEASAVFLADINNDGKLDLYIHKNFASRELWFGNGDGSFRSSPVLLASSVAFSEAAAIADLDLDGDLDIIIANSGQNGANLVLWNGNASIFYHAEKFGTARLGESVADAGDIDADSFSDYLLGAPRGKNANSVETGFVRVISGRDGSTAYTVFGEKAFDRFGSSLSLLGDINNDGKTDFLVGAFGDDRNGNEAGAVSLFSGADGKLLATWSGLAAHDQFGRSVCVAGDVNNDGVPDWIAGAPNHDKNGSNSGMARVISGKDGKVLHDFFGDAAFDFFGVSVCAAGDVNGDGFADLLVGASGNDKGGSDAGQARLFSGKDGKILHSFHGATPNAAFGFAVSGGQDVDRDGVPDLIVGAYLGKDNKGRQTGIVRVYSGKTKAVLFRFAGDAENDSFGRCVSAAGDLNGDGHADILIGAEDGLGPNNKRTGYARVYSGRDGRMLLGRDGSSEGDLFGSAVAGLKDVNNDTVPDFLVGASGRSASSGTAQVFTLPKRGLLGDSGTRFGNFRTFALAVGDLNGDGLPDIVSGNIQSGASSPNKVWFNAGNETFVASQQNIGNSNTHAIAVVDLDRDGLLDIVSGNAAGQANLLWLNDPQNPGTFILSKTKLGTGFIRYLSSADIDSDGHVDLLAGQWGNEVTNMLLLNRLPRALEQRLLTKAKDSGAACVFDVDRDGDLDLLLGSKLWLQK